MIFYFLGTYEICYGMSKALHCELFQLTVVFYAFIRVDISYSSFMRCFLSHFIIANSHSFVFM